MMKWILNFALLFMVLGCDQVTDPSGVNDSDFNTDADTASHTATDTETDTAADSSEVSLSVLLDRTIISPIPDATGITSDGERFWIMKGDGDYGPHELYGFGLSDTESDEPAMVVVENLVNEAGTQVYGIAWDGEFIWVSVSGNANQLHQVDPASGEIVRTIASPTDLGPSDLDWDGTDLWVSSGTQDVFRVNPATLAIETFYDGAGSDRVVGMAVKDNRVWTGDMFEVGPRVFNPDNGELIPLKENEFVTAGMMTFHKDQLVVLADSQIYFYDIVE